MILRSNTRLDYAVYHSTGDKVTKMGDLVLDEKKAWEDVRHSLELYDIGNSETLDDVNEGVTFVNDASKAYRHVHVELKVLLGEDYATKYPDYEANLLKVSDFLKKARDRRKELKHVPEVKVEVPVAAKAVDSTEDVLDVLRVRRDILDMKIKQLNTSMDIQTANDILEVNDYIRKMESFLDDYYDLCGQYKHSLGGEYKEETFEVDLKNVSGDLKIAKTLRRKLTEKSDEKANEQANHAKKDLENDQILRGENLSDEITKRLDMLEVKYSMDLDKLGDYQILEVSQNKNLDSEFNTVLEKVTDLSGLVSGGGAEVRNLWVTATKKRDSVSEKRTAFLKKLQSIIEQRDVTPEKMKNATTLRIELPKFGGYESKMDFYTFKSEFQKLVEPVVQKQFLADYLKRNYLCGAALNLVDKETDYSKIWEKLKGSYGNQRLLLQNKLSHLSNFGGLWKLKGDEKIAEALATLMNSMTELSSLAAAHSIEGQLYEGGGLETVLSLLGDNRHRKFRSQNLESVTDKKCEWDKLSTFLQTELTLREKMILDTKSAQLMGIEVKRDPRKKDPEEPRKPPAYTVSKSDMKCHVCDDVGHPVITTAKGNKIIPYYVCELFVQLSPGNRYSRLKERNLCTSCLFPGHKKGPKHKCFYLNFCCPHTHANQEKIHFLLCETHKTDVKNVQLLEKYKDKFIRNNNSLPNFSLNIACMTMSIFVTNPTGSCFDGLNSRPDVQDSAIFMLQTIFVCGVRLNIFFDNGCGDLVVRRSAVDKLLELGRAKLAIPGPLQIVGVGDQKSFAEGMFFICLPLYDGSNVTLSGVCLPKITSEFPTYDLQSVEADLKSWSPVRGVDFPKLPSSVGGDVDILVGSKYLRYFPKVVFEHETGLGIYKSPFAGVDGCRGVLNGPHPKFSEIERNFRGNHVKSETYFVRAAQLIRSGATYEAPLLGIKVDPTLELLDQPFCCTNIDSVRPEVMVGENANVALARKPPKCVRQFDAVEQSGTEITYRCVDHRDCSKCKNGPRVDAVSLQEEYEDVLIDRSVTVDIDKGISLAKLPFVVDPDSRIAVAEQQRLALRVFKGQVRSLNASGKEKDRAAVIESERKLEELGFVVRLENLTEAQREMILKAIFYILPWRAVHNENSVSTPTRMVFDASLGTSNGCSLNTLLAKGSNSLNKLVEIMIRWLTQVHAFHTDVSKMYNRVALDPEHWRYQLYFWSEGLELGVEPFLKVIMTLIYGVRPSGNLAQCALRRTAELCAEEFPRALNPILKDTYMDDCISGTEGPESSRLTMDEIQCAVTKGGFSVKGFVVSGEDPPAALSDGKLFILVGGTIWFSKGDFIALNIGEVNFCKRVRGKKSGDGVGVIPAILTKWHCVSRSSEVFDIIGLVAPLLGGIKIDISDLHIRCPMWDSPIPAELKEIWMKNFDLVDEIRHLKFRRAVVPSDAVSLDMETIETADAGERLICAAVYARFKRKDGSWSCQLIFARTKIVHDLSIPRAELEAALLNSSTGHVVKSSLGDMVKRSWKLSDSQVALHWINCIRYALKMWVRNRVVEVTRLTDLSSWHYVRSKDNIADLGTRKGAQIADVSPESDWINGFPWMKENDENFPIMEYGKIVLSGDEKSDADKEKVAVDLDDSSQCLISRSVPSEVGDRYTFSKYLIDPNRFRFKTVIRILGFVFLFLKKLTMKLNQKRQQETNLGFLRKRDFSTCASNDVTGHYFVSRVNFSLTASRIFVAHLSEDILNAAKAYFFEKATSEIIHFLEPKKYEKFSKMVDGILYFTGRILLVQEIDGQSHLADACLDLAASTFCVPITDVHSPVACSVVAETHWHSPDVSHGGVESVLRYAQQTAYIIGGRALVKCMKKTCPRCRFLQKKGVRVAMGPVSDDNLRIAPPFFVSQVDICGHFSAYSPANKRATLKVWFVVFCCTVTGATDCRIMEDYSADGFMMAFARFACRFGYPQKLLPDEGGQLVKGCKEMIISMSDIKQKLSVEHGVEFETCPVGAHNAHGKVERKIQEVKRSLEKCVGNKRLSILQWETLGQQISNSINNLPIGLGNKTEMLENLDILTPNRLLLGRNNNRCPTAPLEVSHDVRKIVQSNNEIFKAWFKEWLISFVPNLLDQPKWFVSDRSVAVGDVVLILKSDRAFDLQYQYGLVVTTMEGKDGLIRSVEVEYQNPGEDTKRRTKRGVRELIVIHQVDELGISKELYDLANTD